MRSIFTCLISLLIFSNSAFSDARDAPWLVSWPFFQNAQAPHSIIEGYGDWCVNSEGAHAGLDFGSVSGDSVLAPADIPLFAVQILADVDGYILIFGTDSNSQEGWGVAHLRIKDPYIWSDSIPKAVFPHQPLAPCSLYSVSAPLHMHLQWLNTLPPFFISLYNPFDYFENSLAGYDKVQFNHVRWEEFLSPAGNRGIWFTPDNYETYLQLGFAPGNPDRNLFQSILSGAVDIAVAPFSAQSINGIICREGV